MERNFMEMLETLAVYRARGIIFFSNFVDNVNGACSIFQIFRNRGCRCVDIFFRAGDVQLMMRFMNLSIRAPFFFSLSFQITNLFTEFVFSDSLGNVSARDKSFDKKERKKTLLLFLLRCVRVSASQIRN